MNNQMSQISRQEVLALKRERYFRAGKEQKTKIINEVIELFGYHPKAAIRPLRRRPSMPALFVLGRPKAYDPDRHGWMFDAMNVHTTWSERRGLPARPAFLCFQFEETVGTPRLSLPEIFRAPSSVTPTFESQRLFDVSARHQR